MVIQLPVSVITIGGGPLSGKSTAAKQLAAMTGYERVYAGGILREWCKMPEYNPSRLGFQEWYKTLPKELDLKADEEVQRAGKLHPYAILEGRMAFHWDMNKPTCKVYITCHPLIAAKRLMDLQEKNRSERSEETPYTSLEDATRGVEERMQTEVERYKKLYGVNIHDLRQYDKIIDSSYMKPEDVVEAILATVQQFTSSKSGSYPARNISL